MKKLPRMLIALSSVLLAAMFLFPIWYIGLEAPQYPEGISLYIKLRTIVGGGEFDLTKVNMLNHYIGMKAIDAASIPELKFMPWIVGLLVVTGLAVAWMGKYKAMVTWTAAFIAVALAGLVDFYRWGYDYGHNLAPDAVIKVPGMTYQPPLLGTRQLLNFTAHSWPALGGVAAGIALLLAVAAVVTATRSRRMIGALAFAGVFTGACAPHAARPDFSFDGTASCAYCTMAITDSRVGGVIVTSKGKKYQFDSVDCMASFASANATPADHLWVVDFDHPGTLLPVEEAAFIPKPAGLSAGMGSAVVAVSSLTVSGAASPARSWSQVLSSTSEHAASDPHADTGQP
jgi:copper chaperone NosL